MPGEGERGHGARVRRERSPEAERGRRIPQDVRKGGRSGIKVRQTMKSGFFTNKKTIFNLFSDNLAKFWAKNNIWFRF